MAYVKNIWITDQGISRGEIRINVGLEPAGSVAIEVPIPLDFHNCIVKMAQSAADLHEQQMRAQILADATPTNTDGE